MMERLFVYLLETSVSLGIILLIYRYLFSSLTFFAWNRAILLLLLILSFSIPLMSLDFFGFNGKAVVREITLPVFQVGEQIAIQQPSLEGYLQFLFFLYLGGMILTAGRLIFGFRLSQRLIEEARFILYQGHLIAIHPRFVPASFFEYILMPDFQPESPEHRQIILHEAVHVRLRHSWDLLLVNFAKVVFWFNPLIYLFEKSLREVHEFQADSGVTRSFSAKEYATLLLRLISPRPGWQFMNNFSQFQTKKRIQMLAKRHSAPIQRLRFLGIVPVVGLLMFVFSCEKEELITPIANTLGEFPTALEIKVTHQSNSNTSPEEPISEASSYQIIEVSDEVFDVVEQQPNPEGGMVGWNTYLARNIKYPLEARQQGVEGTVIVVFEIHTDGTIHNVEILRGIGGGADEEAIRVVQNAPKWEPGRQQGRAVKTRMRLPIRFKMETAIQSTPEILLPELPISSQTQLKELTVFGYHSPEK